MCKPFGIGVVVFACGPGVRRATFGTYRTPMMRFRLAQVDLLDSDVDAHCQNAAARDSA
jgi:hypothetical protein